MREYSPAAPTVQSVRIAAPAVAHVRLRARISGPPVHAVEHHFQSGCPSGDEDWSSDTTVDGRIDIDVGQVREDALTIEQALQFLGASTYEKLHQSLISAAAPHRPSTLKGTLTALRMR